MASRTLLHALTDAFRWDKPSSSFPSKLREMLARSWYLGFTCFGGPPVHFQIVRLPYPAASRTITLTHVPPVDPVSQALCGKAGMA